MLPVTQVMRMERNRLVRSLQRRPLVPKNVACRYRSASVLLSEGRTIPASRIHRDGTFRVFQDSCRFFSDSITTLQEERENLRNTIVENVDRGNVAAADKALLQLEALLAQDQTSACPDVDTYTAVLDAWVQRVMDVEEEDGPDRVHLMFQAADRAHSILDKLQQACRMGTSDEDSDTRTLQQHHYDAVLEAWLQVTRVMLQTETPLRGIPQRAQRLLHEMQERCDIQPTIQHYNGVIEMWGNSPEHLRATMAEKLFEEMTTEHGLEPSNETYLILIRALSRSRQGRAAFKATGHLMKMHRDMGDGVEGVQLSMDDYHNILDAWTRAGDKFAPQKAFWVVKLMQKAYMDRVSDVRPDETCYRLVLQTYAQSNLPNLGKDVDELMDQMVDRQLTPDSECYTYAITTWKNSATHYLCETQHEDATHANRMLKRMETAYHRSSSILVQPTVEHYNDVIQAWSTSTRAGAAVHAEALLKKMEKACAEGDETLKPNADSYRWTLEAWANSPSLAKLNRAITILSRMKDATEGNVDNHVKPNTDVFNAFIRVCATSNQGSVADNKYNLKLAVNIVDEMRKRGEAPDSRTFCVLMEACQNLLPLGKQQSRAVEYIFRNCCHHGLVNDEVLAQVQAVATPELYTKLVVANSTEEATEASRSSKMVPKSWTRNVGVKVRTVHGRQPKPLNIDGVFVVTKRIKEHRVRRLRKHTNQRLLRAGRKRYVKNSKMAD